MASPSQNTQTETKKLTKWSQKLNRSAKKPEGVSCIYQADKSV